VAEDCAGSEVVAAGADCDGAEAARAETAGAGADCARAEATDDCEFDCEPVTVWVTP
jgi:hypothetical protein